MLRSQYRKELKLINVSKKSGAGRGEVYVPKLWCFNELRFLDDGETQRECTSTMDPLEEMSKKLTYNKSFLNFGFSFIVNNGMQMPQCVICKKTLANESMKPFKLNEHLTNVHPELANKDLAYFKIKDHQLKWSRLDHGTGVLFQPSSIFKAPYRISLLIAKQKMPHTIGEKLVKPCMVEAARLFLDQNCDNKLNQISLSDNTVKQRIDDMLQDIKSQVIEKIKLSPFFAIQLDETTDVAHLPQLLVYARFISENQVEEEFFFCSPLITTTNAEDIMNIVSNFFEEEKLLWAKLVGVCMYGAPSMLSSKSGFMTLVKTKNPDIIITHCLIHREALASKTLPASFKDTLKIVIRIVNHIKGGALNTRLFCRFCQNMDSAHQNLLFCTSVCWLSKGNVLARVFELFDELQIFLAGQGKKTEQLLNDIQGPFKCSLAHLADVFEALNGLNQQLQGPDTTIMMHTDAIKAFLDKLALWKRKVERGNVASFQCMNEVIREKRLVEELQQEIKEHLIILQEEFEQYFLELINNTAAKEEFQEQQQFNSSNCCVKMFSAFPKTSKFALKVLIPFSSTYLCESGFLTLLVIKSKARNRLNAEADM
ncbi:protein FAM200C-like [Macrobrachium rosenbergii]|uniref:protein FAM200C-like n=1 Tax=Macrobrachium rosenbergii TaxID=79674 RepID=UPI0034D51D22